MNAERKAPDYSLRRVVDGAAMYVNGMTRTMTPDGRMLAFVAIGNALATQWVDAEPCPGRNVAETLRTWSREFATLAGIYEAGADARGEPKIE